MKKLCALAVFVVLLGTAELAQQPTPAGTPSAEDLGDIFAQSAMKALRAINGDILRVDWQKRTDSQRKTSEAIEAAGEEARSYEELQVMTVLRSFWEQKKSNDLVRVQIQRKYSEYLYQYQPPRSVDWEGARDQLVAKDRNIILMAGAESECSKELKAVLRSHKYASMEACSKVAQKVRFSNSVEAH